MVSRFAVVVVSLFLLLAFLEFGPAALQSYLYPDEVFDAPSPMHAKPIVVQNQLDPAYIHAQFLQIDIYSSEGAYYNDDDIDPPSLGLFMFIEPTVVGGTAALAMAGKPRSRRDLLFDRLLAADAGPPTPTSPPLVSDESNLLNASATILTALLPASRPKPFPLPLSPPTFTFVVVIFILISVSLVASVAHLCKLAKTFKASSPSSSPVLIVPTATKPVPSTENAHHQQSASATSCVTIVDSPPAQATPTAHAPPAIIVPAVLPTPAPHAPNISETHSKMIHETSADRTRVSDLPGAVLYQTSAHLHKTSVTERPRNPHVIYETAAPASFVSSTTNSVVYETPVPHAFQNRSGFSQPSAPAPSPFVIYSGSTIYLPFCAPLATLQGSPKDGVWPQCHRSRDLWRHRENVYPLRVGDTQGQGWGAWR
ncbi:hypothetical protein C8F04DRAFT_1400076 [Mycena alexandri]|uniref:Transmembrane protein n=1 Tax=Mycena alexandri TaxID=1745969 RepID=A0AAD6SE30_9AGAR|nr:hypothetical protein C8F04DRAFT_1400076 [Mycena alexandri]